MGSTKTLVQAASLSTGSEAHADRVACYHSLLSVLPAKASAWRTGIQDLAFIKVLKEKSKPQKIRNALATKKDVICSNSLLDFNREGPGGIQHIQ